MFSSPMTLSFEQTSTAIYYLQRVIPHGPYEQEELYGLITNLRSAAQKPASLPKAPSHSGASRASTNK